MTSTTTNTFVFDPDFDYYELFELCMYDGTTQVLDDPEDYTEFIQALKDGRYNPQTETIAPLPLTAEKQEEEELKAYVEKARQGISSRGAGVLVVNETNNFKATFMSGSDIEADLIADEDDEETTTWLKGLLEAVENTDFNTAVLINFIGNERNELRKVSTHPATETITPLTYDYYRFQADGKSYVFETEEEFSQAFGIEYDFIEGVVVDKSNCVVANFYWNDWGFEPTLTYLSNGEDFDNYISSQDGGTGHFVYEYVEVIEDGKVVKRAEGTNPEDPFPPNTQKFADAFVGVDAPLAPEFQEALDDCYFDDVFADAERFKSLILENIGEIAGNFNEENAFCPTGAEPQWLLDALLKAGVEFG